MLFPKPQQSLQREIPVIAHVCPSLSGLGLLIHETGAQRSPWGLSSSDLSGLSIFMLSLRSQVGDDHPIWQMGNRSRQGSNVARSSARGSGRAGMRTQVCRPPAAKSGAPARAGFLRKKCCPKNRPEKGTFGPSCFPSVSSGRAWGGVGGGKGPTTSC